MDKIVTLHGPGKTKKLIESMIGPTSGSHQVIIDERAIPQLEMKVTNNGVELILDRRFSTTIPNEHAYDVAWMIANALAIGSGYWSMNAASKDGPFAPRAAKIEPPAT